MVLCTSCGTENQDGVKFCVRCGAAIASAAAPEPGSWREQSGNLYETQVSNPFGGPGSGAGGASPAGFGQPSTYAPPPATYGGFGGASAGGGLTTAGINGMPFAEWIDRVLAALIDGGIAFAVMIALYIVFGIIGGVLGGIGSSMGSDAVSGLGSLSCCFGFLLAALSVFAVGIYNKVFLVSKRGYSIGQGVMKLRVSDAAGNIPPIGTLVLRLLVQVALGFIPFIGFFLGIANALWPLWDEKKQTLHDKAVSTYVLKTG